MVGVGEDEGSSGLVEIDPGGSGDEVISPNRNGAWVNGNDTPWSTCGQDQRMVGKSSERDHAMLFRDVA